MDWDAEYAGDDEFRRLMRRPDSVDLTLVSLEIARDARPELDFARTLDWIERRGSELRGPVARAKTERGVLRELSSCLSGTHGLHGDRDAFQRDECSFIHRVIETGTGIPISLSVVYMAVARAAGVELDGVATPLHFLTRYETSSGPLFLDAFHQGQVLDYSSCLSWLTNLSGLDYEEVASTLEPAGPRDIVIRMLNNLKALYIRHEQWSGAWNVQRRLTALQPGSYDALRDLSLIAVKSRHPSQAMELLNRLLKVCPPAERGLLQSHLAEAEQQLALWN